MINKKDSGATVLHLPLSEKTKPVDGLMTDYCSNIHFFETWRIKKCCSFQIPDEEVIGRHILKRTAKKIW